MREGRFCAILIAGRSQTVDSKYGEMSEWLKEHAWKACVGETLPRVRIPLSPPITFRGFPQYSHEIIKTQILSAFASMSRRNAEIFGDFSGRLRPSDTSE